MAIYLAKNESMPNIAAGLDEMYSRFASRLQEAVGYAANSHHSLRRVADRYFGRWDTNVLKAVCTSNCAACNWFSFSKSFFAFSLV